MFKIAVLGYGYWGPNLVRNFMSVPGATVSLVADLRKERLEKLKGQYPSITTTAELEDVFRSDCDAVVVATPVHTHYELAKKALLAGKHVLVEKPITSNVDHCQDLIETSLAKKKLLMVDHTFLYHPAVHKVKDLINQGVLGKIRYFDSTRINLGLFQPDVNVLWDLAVHDLSMVHDLVPERPTHVNAVGVSHTHTGIENIGYLSLKYPSGMIAHFNCSWSSPVKLRHILIGGDKKMILFDDLQVTEKVRLYDTGYTVRSDEEKHRLLVDYRHGDIYIPQIDKTEALQNMARDFVSCASQGKTPSGSAESGLFVVKVLCAAQTSMKENGREVKL